MKSILEIEDIPNLLDVDDKGNTIIHLVSKSKKFDIDILNKILVKIRKQFATEADFLTFFHLRNKDKLSAYEYCQFTKNVDFMSVLEYNQKDSGNKGSVIQIEFSLCEVQLQDELSN